MNESTQQGSKWPGGIAAITLFVEDLAAARRFYEEVFRLPVVHEDESSTVFRFGETLVNLLRAAKRPASSNQRRWDPLMAVCAFSSRSA
jgi:catechol 2,3-dioxygenase-like lactoylglutathione lyase family enzyme